MDKLARKFSGTLLKVTGERWAESKARSTYAEFISVPRLNSRERQVFGWRPMLAFSEADIWAMVRDTGVPRHVCYEMGCNRLGCAGCIFSKDHELRIEMRENPAIFEGLELGTEATRTGIIDNARSSKYIELQKDTYLILPDGEYLIETLTDLGIVMDKYKTSEMGQALKKVFRGVMTVEDSTHLAEEEIREVFSHKDEALARGLLFCTLADRALHLTAKR